MRQDLVKATVQSKAADVLDGMTWQEFEMLTAEAFRLQGYRVSVCVRPSHLDGNEPQRTRRSAKFAALMLKLVDSNGPPHQRQ
jgi:hypothetical protein